MNFLIKNKFVQLKNYLYLYYMKSLTKTKLKLIEKQLPQSFVDLLNKFNLSDCIKSHTSKNGELFMFKYSDFTYTFKLDKFNYIDLKEKLNNSNDWNINKRNINFNLLLNGQ